MSDIPEIVYRREPELAKFVNFAWTLARHHITECPGAPQTPYMDEGFAPDRIWIWDTCFMALYCKYAPHLFPGIESLRNFYLPMLDGKTDTPLRIHIPDNPPLFAWAELEYFHMTGDRKHLDEVFFVKKYPQRMFELFESFRAGQSFPYMTSIFPVQWEKTPMGYHWSGGRCGMDNSPRGDFPYTVIDNDPAYRKILFLDAACQQALSAEIIYKVTGESLWGERFESLAERINRFYWDEEDGCYYDIESAPPHRLCKVMTPASYWPLLAGIASEKQAARMAEHVRNPRKLGGLVPFPSVARDSIHFDPSGGYWRGGVWLPVVYMALKGLARYGYSGLVHNLAAKVVEHQYLTWKNFEPHTVWEAYSPTERKPSSCKHHIPDPYARPDFCGWSALGPINLTIEFLLGFYEADAEQRLLKYHFRRIGTHGIRNYRFGDVVCTILSDGESFLSVRTNRPFTLEVDGIPHPVAPRPDGEEIRISVSLPEQ